MAARHGSSNGNLAFAGVQDESRLDAFGLFTGQVGYAWNNVLLYVKGGAAVVRDKYRVFDFTSGLNIDNGSEARWGGTVGAGLEFGFAPNWSIGIEHDHLFMGYRDVDFFFSPGFRGWSAGRLCRDCPYRSGRRYRFGPRELPLGWRGRRDIRIIARTETFHRTESLTILGTLRLSQARNH
ncbi:outer membrane protein [Bradyrhizobium sp. CCGUVB1N3]|uniref:outer membrane protein n=1 Tax=Bradyrhizobium sp. CCGUVB1N3 TaxID=2949629 RepID=UPI003532584E